MGIISTKGLTSKTTTFVPFGEETIFQGAPKSKKLECCSSYDMYLRYMQYRDKYQNNYASYENCSCDCYVNDYHEFDRQMCRNMIGERKKCDDERLSACKIHDEHFQQHICDQNKDTPEHSQLCKEQILKVFGFGKRLWRRFEEFPFGNYRYERFFFEELMHRDFTQGNIMREDLMFKRNGFNANPCFTEANKEEILFTTIISIAKLDECFSIDMDAKEYENAIDVCVGFVEQSVISRVFKINIELQTKNKRADQLNIRREIIEKRIRLLAHNKMMLEFENFVLKTTKILDRIYKTCCETKLFATDERFQIVDDPLHEEISFDGIIPLKIDYAKNKSYRLYKIGGICIILSNWLRKIGIHNDDDDIHFSWYADTHRIGYTINNRKYSNNYIDVIGKCDSTEPHDILYYSIRNYKLHEDGDYNTHTYLSLLKPYNRICPPSIEAYDELYRKMNLCVPTKKHTHVVLYDLIKTLTNLNPLIEQLDINILTIKYFSGLKLSASETIASD